VILGPPGSRDWDQKTLPNGSAGAAHVILAASSGVTFRSNFDLFEPRTVPDEDDLRLSMEERVALVSPLTLDAWAFKAEPVAESRLPRHIVRVLRGRRWVPRRREYAVVRVTEGDKGIDLWVRCSQSNRRVITALKRCGAFENQRKGSSATGHHLSSRHASSQDRRHYWNRRRAISECILQTGSIRILKV